jgi:hypothetical protein
VGDGVGVQVELGKGIGAAIAMGSGGKVGSGRDAVTVTGGTVTLRKESAVDSVSPIDISKVSHPVRGSSPTDKTDTATALIPSQRIFSAL